MGGGAALPNKRPLKSLARAGVVNRTSVAYESLKESIFTNDIKPGDYLSENQVAQSLGMSRTPVREAIKVLASEGLVETHHGVGIFVKRVTVKEISDLFEVRAALECTALQTALDNITDQEIDTILEAWLKQRQLLGSGRKLDLNHVSNLDYQLHSLIVDRCRNDFLKHVIDGIRLKIRRYQRISAMAVADENNTINQHLEIIQCMKNRDLEVLARVLKAHILLAAENIIRHPDWTI
jgi:DNA-binding GntR family transcriptional regulator